MTPESPQAESSEDVTAAPAAVDCSLPGPHDGVGGLVAGWFDLLAQDAISDIQRQKTTNGGLQWNFDESSISRRQSPGPGLVSSGEDATGTPDHAPLSTISPTAALQQPWNSATRLQLEEGEALYWQYYATVVGPILDLVDPGRYFSNVVPHLAMYNTGLLKSVLAVAARHMALHGITNPGSTGHLEGSETISTTQHGATQYYYETLQYVSEKMGCQSYQESPEILSTAVLLSTYEMFDSDNAVSNGNWERHLRGSFWIQRSQDNNGEMSDGLRRATWWAWIRQDLWAAFREGRRTFTIFTARQPPECLTADELATRIFWIASRCVSYAADSNAKQDIVTRLRTGEELLRELSDWSSALPPSFQPIVTTRTDGSTPLRQPSAPGAAGLSPSSPLSTAPVFSPIWIHPASHAAAVQMFHFSRILILLNQPVIGGRSDFLKRQKMLQESVDSICGISITSQGKELPSAFVNAQAVYVGKSRFHPTRPQWLACSESSVGLVNKSAPICLSMAFENEQCRLCVYQLILLHYTAGLCVTGEERKLALFNILTETLEITKFPPKSLVFDLMRIWEEG